MNAIDSIFRAGLMRKTGFHFFASRSWTGRGGGSRTPGLRFWRPPLYQLSYAPVPVSQCTRVFSSYPDGNGETMSELMEEPEGFENESEDEELMSPDHEDDDEEPASE